MYIHAQPPLPPPTHTTRMFTMKLRSGWGRSRQAGIFYYPCNWYTL